MQRTRLSRSSVMKILAQLKQGGYIQLEDGVLTSLNHLPAKY
ncbi:helix-turn-helix domain-containing protein [Klebsiella sp. R390]